MNIKLNFFIPILIIVLILHIFLLQKIFITEDKIVTKKKSKFIAKLVIVNEYKKKKVIKASKEPVLLHKQITRKVEQKKLIKKLEKKVQIKKKIVKKIAKKVKTDKILKATKIIEKKDTNLEKQNTVSVKKTIKKVDKKELIVKSDAMSKKEQVENLNKYILYINNTIQKNKFYPRIAKNMGIEGKCILKFKILKSGEIKNFTLDKKSDFSVLNKAALNILQKIGKFKAFPSYLQKDEIVLKIPIKYILQG